MAQLVAAQYARGLFELALETGQFDVVLDNLLRLKEVVVHDDFRIVLNHPQIDAGEKFSILKGLLGDDVPSETLGFIHLLVEKGRAPILPNVIDEYIKLVDERNNVVLAKVVSAERLSASKLERVKAVLTAKFNKSIRLEEEIDLSVIAGFRVYVGDDLIDTSVKKDISDIRNSLLEFGRAK
jgi:F-type H+-transporting ATPase subunit delta